jgi:hypothetical protein
MMLQSQMLKEKEARDLLLKELCSLGKEPAPVGHNLITLDGHQIAIVNETQQPRMTSLVSPDALLFSYNSIAKSCKGVAIAALKQISRSEKANEQVQQQGH